MDKPTYAAIRKRYDLSIKPVSVFVHYLREAVLASAVYFVWNHHSPLKYAAALLVATLLFRNFSIMHDSVHKALFKNKWANDLLGIISGGICLLPFEQWRRSHLEHHTWSGNLDKDPVTAFISLFPKFPLRVRNVFNLFWKSWFPLLAIVQYTVFWALAAKITLRNRLSPKLAISLAAPAIIWGPALAFAPTSFILGALLPGAIVYFVAVEVVNFPHHLQLPQFRGETRFAFWDQHSVSRSCVYPQWFSTWVVLNFNYHTEHHLYPDVPWYHLEKLQAPVSAVLGELYNTDPHFAWILENKPKSLDAVIHYQAPSAQLITHKAS